MVTLLSDSQTNLREMQKILASESSLNFIKTTNLFDFFYINDHYFYNYTHLKNIQFQRRLKIKNDIKYLNNFKINLGSLEVIFLVISSSLSIQIIKIIKIYFNFHH